MCDQFQQFLKFQKKSVEPMTFHRTRTIGGISLNFMYKVDEVYCKENQDGSVQLDVKYYALKTKWVRRGLGFYRFPVENHTVLTDKNFDENWTFVRPNADEESTNAAVFHNCSNATTKCFMFIATLNGR